MVATFSSEIDSYDWGDALRLLLPVLILAPASWMVVIRRFHDMDRSGFWILLAFVPIVNYVWWLWPLLASGTEGPNKYGGRSSNA